MIKIRCIYKQSSLKELLAATPPRVLKRYLEAGEGGRHHQSYFNFEKKLGGGVVIFSRGDFSREGGGTLPKNSINLPGTYEKLSC